MKSKLFFAACATMASLLCLPAAAQPASGTEAGSPPGASAGSGMGGGRQGMPGSHGRGMRDCSQLPDPAACQARREAMQKSAAVCKDKPAAERRQCMQEQRLNNTDCSASANPQRCQARKQAAGECKDKTGSAFHQCVHDKLPPPDCSKARNPERCMTMQKAREACPGKAGMELRQCIKAQKAAK